MSAKPKKSSKPATGREIRSILGPVDPELVMAVLSTGAACDEIIQAQQWLDGDDYIGKNAGKTMDIRIARVHKILQQDREQNERER